MATNTAGRSRVRGTARASETEVVDLAAWARAYVAQVIALDAHEQDEGRAALARAS